MVKIMQTGWNPAFKGHSGSVALYIKSLPIHELKHPVAKVGHNVAQPSSEALNIYKFCLKTVVYKLYIYKFCRSCSGNVIK